MTTDDPLRLGVLLEVPAIERWAVDAVEEAIRTQGVSVEQVILRTSEDSASTRSWRRYLDSAREYGAWSPVLARHRLLGTPDYHEKVPIEDLEWLDDAETLRVRPEPADPFGRRLPESAIDRIASADIDVLFRRGFGILQGDVLTTPRYGVLSFHHGDIRKYRGRPPAVWEFVNGESTAGVTLQRLTPTLDGGEIVVEKEVDVDGLRTWEGIKRAQFEASTDMLATACRRVRDPSFEPTKPDELGPLYSEPGAIDAARIELANAKGKLLNRLRTDRT